MFWTVFLSFAKDTGRLQRTEGLMDEAMPCKIPPPPLSQNTEDGPSLSPPV